MAQNLDQPFPGLYTVKTRHYRRETKVEDLTFSQAMRLIQDRFESSKGIAFFASIERQA